MLKFRLVYRAWGYYGLKQDPNTVALPQNTLNLYDQHLPYQSILSLLQHHSLNDSLLIVILFGTWIVKSRMVLKAQRA